MDINWKAVEGLIFSECYATIFGSLPLGDMFVMQKEDHSAISLMQVPWREGADPRGGLLVLDFTPTIRWP